MAADRPEHLLSQRLLHLIVMPTEQCQLRCAYCWEDFESGRMQPAIVRGLKRWIAARAPRLDLLAIEWFGGEPLLANDLIDELQAFALNTARRFDVELRGGITTNGLLLDQKRLERLVDLGIREYQVTLDGPREVHDTWRASARGRGSFDAVWTNLLAARETEGEFKVRLRINLSAATLSAVSLFLRDCSQAFGSDPRFRVAFYPLHATNSSRDASLPFLDRRDERRIVDDLTEQARALGLRVYEGPFVGAAPKLACYAASASSFVVRANGDLAKCTVALRHPKNRVGRLREDGTVEIDQGLMGGWLRGTFSHRRKELECPASGWLSKPESNPLLPVV